LTFLNFTLISKLEVIPVTKISVIIPGDIILKEKSISLTFSIQVFIKPCEVGEIILSSFICHQCEKNYYSLREPMENFDLDLIKSSPQKCIPCPIQAVCPGGALIYTKKGFWKTQSLSKVFFSPCPVPSDCIDFEERIKDSNDFNILCDEGSEGFMCHNCKEGFARLSEVFTQ
jgi:hypothetical protein